MALFFEPSFILRLPFSPDLLGGGQFTLFRLILGRNDNLTEFPVKFLLELREVLLDQTALL